MEFRITENVSEEDIEAIHRKLKRYNLSKRESSENIPIGIFVEDEEAVRRKCKYVLSIHSVFRHLNFTENMDTKKYFRLMNIRIPDHVIILQKYYNFLLSEKMIWVERKPSK